MLFCAGKKVHQPLFKIYDPLEIELIIQRNALVFGAVKQKNHSFKKSGFPY
jgi:hypothetical protein